MNTKLKIFRFYSFYSLNNCLMECQESCKIKGKLNVNGTQLKKGGIHYPDVKKSRSFSKSVAVKVFKFYYKKKIQLRKRFSDKVESSTVYPN